MKKLPFLFTLTIFTLTLFLTSCGDSDDIAPTIALLIMNNQTIMAGQAVVVSAVITDNEEIAQIRLVSEGTVTLNESITTFDSPTMHALSANITIADMTPVGDYNINIIASDAEGNSTTESINFTVTN